MSCTAVHPQSSRQCVILNPHATHCYKDVDGNWVFWTDKPPPVRIRHRPPSTGEMLSLAKRVESMYRSADPDTSAEAAQATANVRARRDMMLMLGAYARAEEPLTDDEAMSAVLASGDEVAYPESLRRRAGDLRDSKYIMVVGKRPSKAPGASGRSRTVCAITDKGRGAL